MAASCPVKQHAQRISETVRLGHPRMQPHSDRSLLFLGRFMSRPATCTSPRRYLPDGEARLGHPRMQPHSDRSLPRVTRPCFVNAQEIGSAVSWLLHVPSSNIQSVSPRRCGEDISACCHTETEVCCFLAASRLVQQHAKRIPKTAARTSQDAATLIQKLMIKLAN